MSEERQPPHTLEMEEAVLGSLLINPDGWVEVSKFLVPGDFYIIRNAWVYEAIQRLNARDEGVDYATVEEELRTQGRLDEIGGAAYLTYLINHSPTTMYTVTYAHMVHRAALRRDLLAAAQDIVTLALDEQKDAGEVVGLSRARINRVRSPYAPQPTSWASITEEAEVYRQKAVSGGAAFYRTGFEELDTLLGGVVPNDLWIIGGLTGTGKSSWGHQVLLNVAYRQKIPVFLLSREMGGVQVHQRIMAQVTGIGTDKQRTGNLTEGEQDALVTASARLSTLPIHTEYYQDASRLLADIENSFYERGTRLVIVDYIQLLSMPSVKGGRVNELTAISSGLKHLALKLGLGIIALSQLSRDIMGRDDKHPRLSDLRESGSLEQDADVVIFIHRDDIFDPELKKFETRPGVADFVVAKNRHGPTGRMSYFYKRPELTFVPLPRKVPVPSTHYHTGEDEK